MYISLNNQHTKNLKFLPQKNPIYNADFAMWKNNKLICEKYLQI